MEAMEKTIENMQTMKTMQIMETLETMETMDTMAATLFRVTTAPLPCKTTNAFNRTKRLEPKRHQACIHKKKRSTKKRGVY